RPPPCSTPFPYTTLFRSRFGLGIASFNQLAGKVDLVINCAASVDFREELDKALTINTLSLRHLAHFCQVGGDLPLLQVSTCYVRDRKSTRLNSSHVKISY